MFEIIFEKEFHSPWFLWFCSIIICYKYKNNRLIFHFDYWKLYNSGKYDIGNDQINNVGI